MPGKSVVGTRVIPFTIKQKDMEDLYYSKVENPTYESGKNLYEPPVAVKISSDSAEELLAIMIIQSTIIITRRRQRRIIRWDHT